MVLILLPKTVGIPAVQLFQPFSQFIPVGLASHTTLAVWAVDSEKGQQATDPASKVQLTTAEFEAASPQTPTPIRIHD